MNNNANNSSIKLVLIIMLMITIRCFVEIIVCI